MDRAKTAKSKDREKSKKREEIKKDNIYDEDQLRSAKSKET